MERSYTTNGKSKVVNFAQENHSNPTYKTINYINYEEGGSMDDLLQKYIEKVDRDQSDLRTDIRESENRVNGKIVDAEQRMDKRLDKIEEMIMEQNKKMEVLTERVSEKLEDDRKYRHTNNIAILLGVVATVIALAGIYYATVSTITDILGMIPK